VLVPNWWTRVPPLHAKLVLVKKKRYIIIIIYNLNPKLFVLYNKIVIDYYNGELKTHTIKIFEES